MLLQNYSKLKMRPKTKAYIELHIAVFLFGFTAILGDLISIESIPLVWWRVLITCISLFFLINLFKTIRKIPRKLLLIYLGTGVIVALHWITFFGAIKVANASICLVALATTSLFTSILEPIILKFKHRWYEIAIGLLIIPGMVLVANNIEVSKLAGIWLGLISAFLAALFSIINKKYIEGSDTMSITFLELGAAFLFISFILPFYYQYNPEMLFMPKGMDWVYLLILALLCTTFAYVLALGALKHISAFAANLTVNLEPVYGILLAIFILKENQELSTGFYLGVLVILIAVFIHPIISKRMSSE